MTSNIGKVQVREECVICGEHKLESIYQIEDFPVYAGVVTGPPENDIVYDLEFACCKRCDTIQLNKLAPLSEVYVANHNDAVGPTWAAHHDCFAAFINRWAGGSVLEIGGGSGITARAYRQIGGTANWTIVEPNPILPPGIENIQLVEGWFDDDFEPDGDYDTIVHSHVFEHWYRPLDTIRSMSRILGTSNRVCCSIPNMDHMLKIGSLNAITFEHTYFINPQRADFLMAQLGFIPVAKEQFRDHSYFFCYEKSNFAVEAIDFEKDISSHFLQLMRQATERATDFNRLAKDSQPNYLFGAHVFNQYLLRLGLKEQNISGLLDNSKMKAGKRLCGTSLHSELPETSLEKQLSARIFLNCGVYNAEIKMALEEKFTGVLEIHQ